MFCIKECIYKKTRCWFTWRSDDRVSLINNTTLLYKYTTDNQIWLNRLNIVISKDNNALSFVVEYIWILFKIAQYGTDDEQMMNKSHIVQYICIKVMYIIYMLCTEVNLERYPIFVCGENWIKFQFLLGTF